MKTVVPDPPLHSNVASFVDTEAAERAFAHYELPPQTHRKPNLEDTLNNIDSILHSAAATAYEYADNSAAHHANWRWLRCI